MIFVFCFFLVLCLASGVFNVGSECMASIDMLWNIRIHNSGNVQL